MVFEEIAKAVNGSGDARLRACGMPLPAGDRGAELKKHVIARRAGGAHRVRSLHAGRRRQSSLTMPQRVLLKHRGDKAPAVAAGRAGGD